MSIKKTFCIHFLCILMLTVFIFPSSAAEVDGFYSRNMVHKAYIMKNVDNVLTPFDYTDHLTVSNGTYAGQNCTVYTLSGSSENGIRYVSSYQIKELSASHEYHLKFSASSNRVSDSSLCYVSLVFYNGDEVLKTQELGGCVFTNDQWQEVEFDFVPDTSGLGGYSTRLEFLFMSYSTYDSAVYRLSEFIELEDKDDNAGWFQKIINAIKEILEKIGDLRDNISNYFSALGDRITAKFESVGTSITNKFEEVKNAIGSWFTEIGDKLSNKFSEVGNAITSKFQEIGAEFSAMFDTFKPRFYEQFIWTYGLYFDSGYETFPKEDDIGYAVISEPFVVPQGTTYKLSLTFSDLFTLDKGSNYVFQIYDIGSGGVIADEFVDYAISFNYEWELEPGNAYVFSLYHCGYESFDSVFPGISLNDICNSVVKVYADEGWLTAFGRMILNGIKNFFETLKNNILYFQSPVTLNSEGILVDVNGEPVYVNPFGGVTFADTIKGWADDLLEFSSSIDDSADTVSEWLSSMSNIINKMLKRVPLLSGLLIFAVVFIVVRKVVGR